MFCQQNLSSDCMGWNPFGDGTYHRGKVRKHIMNPGDKVKCIVSYAIDYNREGIIVDPGHRDKRLIWVLFPGEKNPIGFPKISLRKVQ